MTSCSIALITLIFLLSLLLSMAEDYWVLYVDYDAYAIVYSCSDRSRDGSCNSNAKHVWVMSRLMAPLSDREMVEVDKILQNVCVDPKHLEIIPNGKKLSLMVQDYP